MLNNMLEPNRQQTTIRRMRFACRILKDTTHTQIM